MRNPFKTFWWWLYRKNNDLPHRNEVEFLVSSKRQHSMITGSVMPRRYDMANLYAYGNTLESIAGNYGTSRERIRNCVWKVWRDERVRLGIDKELRSQWDC